VLGLPARLVSARRLAPFFAAYASSDGSVHHPHRTRDDVSRAPLAQRMAACSSVEASLLHQDGASEDVRLLLHVRLLGGSCCHVRS